MKSVGTGPPEVSTETMGAPVSTTRSAGRPRLVCAAAPAAIRNVLPTPEIVNDRAPELVRLTTTGNRSAACNDVFNGVNAVCTWVSSCWRVVLPEVDADVIVIGVTGPPSTVALNVALAVNLPLAGTAVMPVTEAVGICAGVSPSPNDAGSSGESVTVMELNVPAARLSTSARPSGTATLLAVTRLASRPADSRA